ncbi:MAG: 2,4-diketo-3-deoxy-L-fuconate hydrolase [Candidatus Azotimanducaceae bacterium]
MTKKIETRLKKKLVRGEHTVKTILQGTAALLIAGIVGLITYSLYLSRPLFDEHLDTTILASPAIAPPDRALTFARFVIEDEVHTLLVERISNGQVQGFDLQQAFPGQHPITLHQQLGFDGLLALRAEHKTTSPEGTTVPITALRQPQAFNYPHIAAGTNYAEHAEEVYVDDPPFLFPKLAKTSTFNAPVKAMTSHLDFEAELCLVPLADIARPEQQVPMGLVLCNDFTDRWMLLKELRLAAAMGTTGFASAKGRTGYLPVGYLLVIPRDPQFYTQIDFQLYVNGEMRQNASAQSMILKPQDIIRQAFISAAQTYYRGDETVHLLPSGIIPAGTLILSGTPGGVIFKPLNAWNPLLYLAPGDQVITTANFLGHLDNTVE